MLPRIFDYKDFASFLSAYVKARKDDDGAYSYRRLANRMGVKSVSHVHMVASGQRVPTPALLEKFRAALPLDDREFAYAEAIVALQQAEGDTERAYAAERVEELRPRDNDTRLDSDVFSLLTRWYHLAVMEAPSLADFKPDPKWIAARLDGDVTPEQVKESIELLARLGLIQLDEKGRPLRNDKSYMTQPNIPSAAVRNYHKEFLQRAALAIESQPVTERFFTGVTLTVDAEALPEAQRLIAEFQAKFTRLAHKRGGDETYHFAVQFFRLTRPVRRKESRK